MKKPPDWAYDRVEELYSDFYMRGSGLESNTMKGAFAAYIAEHEKPPVDPLLVEARGIIAGRIFESSFDADQSEAIAYDALKRGIEIGKGVVPLP